VITRDTNPEAYHFSSDAGVLSSRKSEPQFRASTRPGQSRIYYHRPLRSGEAVRYEFLYDPGTSGTHPAIWRLAFLLDPEGVRMHWITDGDLISAWSGLKYDNSIAEPQHRRGNAPLPLKSSEWNAVRVALQANDFSIELNGVEICRRPLEENSLRHFGFSHFPQKKRLRVRNVVLTGSWPERLTTEQLANLAALAPQEPSAAREKAFLRSRSAH
jgi:hypothetical protein